VTIMRIPIRLDPRAFGLAWRPSHQHPKRPELIALLENLNAGKRSYGCASITSKYLNSTAAPAVGKVALTGGTPIESLGA
jgi:hypothetical protein